MREVLGIETEISIAGRLLFQIGDVENCPLLTLQQFHLSGMVRFLVNCDKKFLDLIAGLRGSQMHYMIVAIAVQRGVVSLFVQMEEVIGIDSLQLCLCGVDDVHLVIVFHICPLRLAVEPYAGMWSGGVEFLAFDNDGAAG